MTAPVLRPLPPDPACDLPDATRLWVERAHTPVEMEAALEFMVATLPRDQVLRWPTSLLECVTEIKLIIDDLDAAGLPVSAGGGAEAADHVRTLLLMRDRMARIADQHRKQVDEHGGTYGMCAECGWRWPCPTYDWARETSDRDPATDAWDRSDDFPLEDEEPSGV